MSPFCSNYSVILECLGCKRCLLVLVFSWTGCFFICLKWTPQNGGRNCPRSPQSATGVGHVFFANAPMRGTQWCHPYPGIIHLQIAVDSMNLRLYLVCCPLIWLQLWASIQSSSNMCLGTVGKKLIRSQGSPQWTRQGSIWYSSGRFYLGCSWLLSFLEPGICSAEGVQTSIVEIS